jgi:hypothetical protein
MRRLFTLGVAGWLLAGSLLAGPALAVRPDEVLPDAALEARARALATDPSYPSADIIKRVGEQILGAPDLSEDQS